MREMYNSTFVHLKNFVLLYFWIPDSGFRNPDSGFRFPESGFRIPDSSFHIPAFRVALKANKSNNKPADISVVTKTWNDLQPPQQHLQPLTNNRIPS